jgi:hypothetical protein
MPIRIIKGKKYREVKGNPKDVKQANKYRLVTEKKNKPKASGLKERTKRKF